MSNATTTVEIWRPLTERESYEQGRLIYANRIGYSDVTPCEIIRFVSDKCIEIREMDAVHSPDWKPEFVPGGFSAICTNNGQQHWDCTSNPANPIYRIRLSKNKGWRSAHNASYRLHTQPVKHYDYNF
jgi:hypothetical protein